MQEPVGETTELKSGLPDNTASIDGYFYCYQYSPTLMAYACLRDPSENLMSSLNHRTGKLFNESNLRGNIDVRQVTFSGSGLSKIITGTACYYMYEVAGGVVNSQARWNTDANQAFKSLDQVVTRSFPAINADSVCSQPVYKSSGITYHAKDLAANFDSLLITLTDGYYYTTPVFKKLTPSDSSVTFTAADLAKLHSTAVTGYFYLQAFNYSWRMYNGKKYVFELARRKNYTVSLEP
jgi:hypothetical protein